MSRELILLLENYDFPGNIRELRAMVFDAVSTHHSGDLSIRAFKSAIDSIPALGNASLKSELLFVDLSTLPTLKQSAELLVDEAMKRAKGKQSLAARLLGISQPALSKRLKKSLKQE